MKTNPAKPVLAVLLIVCYQIAQSTFMPLLSNSVAVDQLANDNYYYAQMQLFNSIKGYGQFVVIILILLIFKKELMALAGKIQNTFKGDSNV